MSASARYTIFTNNTAGLITNPAVKYGNDWATQVLSKTFVAAEIGTGAGQTRDTTTDPTVGFLFAQLYGPPIQDVINIKMIYPLVATNRSFNTFITRTNNYFVKIGYRIDNTVSGVSSLYIIDQGGTFTAQIGVNYKVMITVAIGYP